MTKSVVKDQNKHVAKKVALYGVLIALAFVFSYVEALIPFSFAIPGMKVGLAKEKGISAST